VESDRRRLRRARDDRNARRRTNPSSGFYTQRCDAGAVYVGDAGRSHGRSRGVGIQREGLGSRPLPRREGAIEGGDANRRAAPPPRPSTSGTHPRCFAQAEADTHDLVPSQQAAELIEGLRSHKIEHDVDGHLNKWSALSVSRAITTLLIDEL